MFLTFRISSIPEPQVHRLRSSAGAEACPIALPGRCGDGPGCTRCPAQSVPPVLRSDGTHQLVRRFCRPRQVRTALVKTVMTVLEQVGRGADAPANLARKGLCTENGSAPGIVSAQKIRDRVVGGIRSWGGWSVHRPSVCSRRYASTAEIGAPDTEYGLRTIGVP